MIPLFLVLSTGTEEIFLKKYTKVEKNILLMLDKTVRICYNDITCMERFIIKAPSVRTRGMGFRSGRLRASARRSMQFLRKEILR